MRLTKGQFIYYFGGQCIHTLASEQSILRMVKTKTVESTGNDHSNPLRELKDNPF